MAGYSDPALDGWHVVPMDDLRPNESKSTCWCNPVPDVEEPAVWIHNSLDGREHTKEKGVLQ